ncbi:GDP-L-fucose synthase family protein [Flexibacterium corallicola]|uniref:GDP-L-fucose synthase family protein n=1 Tax=Flexibacterium corallicola TaxID=3037259 RepID=UPI00286ED5CD|nr:GDP-L-fucose synthase [Pseudovibrio sp. M1P-2-3]
MNYDISGKRIWIAGHTGMVGRALLRRLKRIDCEVLTASRKRLNLTRQGAVENFLQTNKPDIIIIAAAKVGGILANDRQPAEFLYENLMIEANIIHAAHEADVERLLFLGSSCAYPKFAPQPIKELSLLQGPLEATNQWYAIAKIAGLKLVESYRKQFGCSYISAMPTNLYGPADNFDLETGHVLPALLAKAHSAKTNDEKTLHIWGTGAPHREFLYVDDLADALVFLLKNYDGDTPINVGSGEDLSILKLTEKISKTVGFNGYIQRDLSKPDGTPRKLIDSQKLKELGWSPSTPLEKGLAQTYRWYLKNIIEKQEVEEVVE